MGNVTDGQIFPLYEWLPGTLPGIKRASVTIHVQAPAKVSTVLIDNPKSSPAIAGNQLFSGWAVDPQLVIASVTFTIDGVNFGSASLGIPRPDVCALATYAGDPGCPNVGWNYSLNTATLSSDTHTLAVTAFASDNRAQTSTVQFTTANPESMHGNIDSPQGPGTYSGVTTFQGWAGDTVSAIGSVALVVDNASPQQATLGIVRTDVCVPAEFPTLIGCPKVGWALSYDTTKVPNGSRNLTVTVSTNGKIPRVLSLHSSFLVANGSSSPPDPKLAPGTPTKEYILLNGKPIVIENAH